MCLKCVGNDSFQHELCKNYNSIITNKMTKKIYITPKTDAFKVNLSAMLIMNSKGELDPEDGNVNEGLSKGVDFIDEDADNGSSTISYDAWNDEL